jgi:PQQ-dependent dehydrogenase (s-GDH family)
MLPLSRRTTAALSLPLVSLIGISLAQNPPESALSPDKRFTKRVIVSGLSNPWELAWGPDNHLWVTERTGKRITRIDPATGARATAITLKDAAAPGGQDGVLGMALHPQLLKGTGNDYVYVAYTTIDRSQRPDPDVTDPASPYRHLYMRVVRLTYNPKTRTLSNPTPILTGLPAGDDHNGGRLKFGPGDKLYLTLGDQGHNQFGNFCLPIESQRLPTAAEIAARDYSAYAGKILRFNLDGSIPADNPSIGGVVSHVFTYGHRNPQGLTFAPDGTPYESEHGPKSDDEVNVLHPGANYGWPHVAGFKDNKAYVYARWAEAATPCRQLEYNDFTIPPVVPQQLESDFTEPFHDPLATLFTVPSGFNFESPACKGFEFICWPTVGIASLEYYESGPDGIPGWDRALLVSSLKRGSLYVIPLQPGGQSTTGRIYRYFRAENRYRDVEIGPDRRTIYLATDSTGVAESLDGRVTSAMQDKGAILAFTYAGEGPEDPPLLSKASHAAEEPSTARAAGAPPQFTSAQAAAGKKTYQTRCAVCHGTTLTNGAYGTPLAGDYFQKKWSGRTVRALYDKSRAMPPSAPASLPSSAYADVVAYILQANGAQPGAAPLQPAGEFLDRMTIR